MAQKLRLEAEMKDNASPAVKQLRAALSELQATSAEVNGTAKLNAELAKLAKESEVNASPAVQKLRAQLAELQKGTAAQQAVAALNKEIAALKKSSGDLAPTAGMKSLGGWFGEAQGKVGAFVGTARDLPGILSGIGIGAIGAGASVAGLAAEMKKVGEHALDLKELSRQTGMSKEFVSAWEEAGPHFGVAKEQMDGMLDSFSAQLPGFLTGQSAMLKEFSRWPDTIAKIKKDIEQNNPAQALVDALKQAERAGVEIGPQVQKQILQSMGLGDQSEKLFAKHGLSGLLDQLAKGGAAPSDRLTDAAGKARDATADLNTEITRFSNSVAPGFLDRLATAAERTAAIVGALRQLKDGLTEEEKKADETLHRQIKPPNPDNPYALGKQRLEATPMPGPGSSIVPSIMEWLFKWRGSAQRGDTPAPGKTALLHHSSYDGPDYRAMLRDASFTSGSDDFRSVIRQASYGGGSGDGTMEGAVSDGAKAGVLQAFRELAVEQDVKDRIKSSLGGGGGGGGFGGDAGPGSGGRRGFMWHGGRFGGAGDGGGSYDGALPSSSAAGNLTKLIDAEAKRAGIDPRILEGIRAGESGHKDTYDHAGKGEDSWGPFQLNRAGGLGNNFERETAAARKAAGLGGLEDPRTIPMQTRWVAEYIKRHGRGVLGAWHGYHGDRDADPRWRDSGYTPGKDSEVAGQGGVAGPMSADVKARLEEAKKHTFLGINQECVSLAREFSRSAESVFDWRKGDAAAGGSLKPGTPIATFMKNQMEQSDRFGDGTAGRPGRNLDHAGIFEGYATRNGRRGMMILEQSRGRPVHERFYPFNEGAGERNGSNYFAVKSARTGHYLGERNNPMNRRADAPLAAAHPNAGRRAHGLPSGGGHADAARSPGSEHSLAISFHDPAGMMKSHRLQTSGGLKVDVKKNWPAGHNPLLRI